MTPSEFSGVLMVAEESPPAPGASGVVRGVRGLETLEGLSLLLQLNAARLPRREREATRKLTLLFMRLFLRALAVSGVVQRKLRLDCHELPTPDRGRAQ